MRVVVPDWILKHVQNFPALVICEEKSETGIKVVVAECNSAFAVCMHLSRARALKKTKCQISSSVFGSAKT